MGSLAVDEADNEIVDPNNVNETTDIHQTKKQAEKNVDKKLRGRQCSKHKLKNKTNKNKLTCDSGFSNSASYFVVLTRIPLLFELLLDISFYQKFTYVTLLIADGCYKTINFHVGCRRIFKKLNLCDPNLSGDKLI